MDQLPMIPDFGQQNRTRGSVEISYKTGKTEHTSNIVHSHEKFELYYLVSGIHFTKSFMVEDRQYTLKAGDIILIPPWFSHKSECDNLASYDRIVLLFDQPLIKPLYGVFEQILPDAGFLERERLFSMSPYGRSSLDVIMKAISNELSQRDSQYLSMVSLMIAEVFITVLRYGAINGSLFAKRDQKNSTAMKDISEYINAHYNEPLSLSSLSAEFFMNASALSRSFKNAIGVTLTEYISQVRIERAKEIIEREEISIPNVAERVGINTPTYFTKIFRKYTGLTPIEYRRSIR